MKLYLSVIRGEVQIRPYKTRMVIYEFDSREPCKYAGVDKFVIPINLIFASVDWLIHEKRLVYFDEDNNLSLTDKALKMYWDKRRHEV